MLAGDFVQLLYCYCQIEKQRYYLSFSLLFTASVFYNKGMSINLIGFYFVKSLLNHDIFTSVWINDALLSTVIRDTNDWECLIDFSVIDDICICFFTND